MIKRSGSKILTLFRKVYWISFVLFLFNLCIGCSKATNFLLFDNQAGWDDYRAGDHGGNLNYASSLALGSKNTMFALGIALDFIRPLVAMGPIFYILFQNAYNSLQIQQVEEKVRLSDEPN